MFVRERNPERVFSLTKTLIDTERLSERPAPVFYHSRVQLSRDVVGFTPYTHAHDNG